MPRAAGLWTAVYLGVFVAALFWLAAGSWRWLRRVVGRTRERFRMVFARRKPPANPPAATPVVPPAATGAV